MFFLAYIYIFECDYAKGLKPKISHRCHWQRMEFRSSYDSVFFYKVFRAHHVSGVRQEHTSGTCKAQLFLPIYDLQDKEIFLCLFLFIKDMLPTSNNGKLTQQEGSSMVVEKMKKFQHILAS